ncbi:MAG: GNAT family N-acetyltransferase [Nitrososphaerota archaeon]|nr:GNAT family N-acetyltransferase [Nitrososphaerota archaeon]
MTKFSVRELGPETWPDFTKIVEKHNGIWGGCWCVAFHCKPGEDWSSRGAAQNRRLKERLVMAGMTHNALVYDGDRTVGFCQFGSPAEIPSRMSGYARLGLDLPDWRIPCFFVDRDYRRSGVAKAALEGALRIIAKKGGGTVDAYPISVHNKEYGSSFLWGGTGAMFAEAGFEQVGRLGKSKVVMRKTVRQQR